MKALAVYIDRQQLTLATLKGDNYQEEKVKIDSDKDISEIIKKFLFKNKLIKPEKVIIGIPRHLAIIKYLTLPSQDEEEIKRILGYEIINLFLYPPEDLIWDWKVIEKRADGYSELMLVAIQKKVIFKYISYIENIGLIPDRIMLSTFSLYNQILFKKQISSKKVLVVCLENNALEILAIDKGKLVFSRGISPVQEDQLTEEIKVSVTSYQKEARFKVIDEIILVVDEENKKKILPKIEKVFASKPQVVDSVSLAKGFLLEDSKLKLNLDFLPSEIKSLKKLRKKKKEFVWLLSILFVLFSLLISILMVKIKKLEGYLNLLTENIKKIQPEVENLKIKELKINLINDYLISQISTLDILTELYRISPQGISFSRLILDRENASLVILGEADSFKNAFLFMDKLKKSPLIKKPKFRYISSRKLTEKEVVNFEVIASF